MIERWAGSKLEALRVGRRFRLSRRYVILGESASKPFIVIHVHEAEGERPADWRLDETLSTELSRGDCVIQWSHKIGSGAVGVDEGSAGGPRAIWFSNPVLRMVASQASN